MKDIKSKFIIIIALIFLGCVNTYSNGLNKVCFDDVCVNVEVAKTLEEKTRGLQFRNQLCDDCGMLFVFDQLKIHSFWMKDTLIPLDMIWLDNKKKIVDIAYDVQPCISEPCQVYSPHSDAMYVLELNSGTTKSLNANIGDSVRFELSDE